MKILNLKFNTTSLLLLVFFILCFLSILWKTSWQIGGDGFGYYSYLRSFVFDNNFNLNNEFALFDNLYGHDTVDKWQSSTGQIRNPYAVGSAILWLPFVLIAFVIDNFFNFYDPYFLTGFNFPYQAAVATATWFYFLLGIALIYNTLNKIIKNSYAWLASLSIVLISPVLFYLVYEPSMAHGLTVFSTGLFFYLNFKIYKSSKIKLKYFIYLGISAGLLFLIRWQDIVFAIIPLLILVKKVRAEKQFLKYFKATLLSILFFLITILPQLLMWKYIFNSYISVPQGSSFFSLLKPHFFEFLFSSYHGMLIVHPLLILSLLGLFLSFKKHKFFPWLLLISLLLQIYINSGLYDWYGGGSFGARRMVSSLFIFVYGLGFLISLVYNKKVLRVVLVVLLFTGLIFNVLLMMSYAKGIIPLNEFTSYSQFYKAPLEVLKSL